MILFVRSNHIICDSRVLKYAKACEAAQIPFLIVGWDRTGTTNAQPNCIFYQKNAPYGRSWKNALPLLNWNLFLLRKLWKHRKETSVIHACDLDTAVPALLMRLMGYRVVYDIFDVYAYSHPFPRKLQWLVLRFEQSILRFFDLIILPDSRRRSQIKIPDERWIEIENVPEACADHELKKDSERHILKIAYTGSLGPERGIETLISAVNQLSFVELTIAGIGVLEDFARDAARKNPRITFKGSVSAKEALDIQASADLVYAAYERGGLFHKNHLLAAPNKYFEALLLGRPIITTTGTLVGDKTEEGRTGFVIDESLSSLTALLTNLQENRSRMERAAGLALDKWKQHYAEYFDKHYVRYVKDTFSKAR